MSREVKRVPLDFSHPLKEVWPGYLSPDSLDGITCTACDGSGESPEARRLHALWYGNAPFTPEHPFTHETPEVRAFAERNVSSAPGYYGSGEGAIRREAKRLADLWNGMWMHHLTQDDVDVLVANDSLRDFTHTRTEDRKWQKIEPGAVVTADQVNRWSIGTMSGPDLWPLMKHHCQKQGVPVECTTCEGYGNVEAYPGQRADADAWEPTEPPTGDGWQLWETTSEGSPVTPVFATADELVHHIASPNYGYGFAGSRISLEAARALVGSGWAPSMVVIGNTIHTSENAPLAITKADQS